MHYKSFLLDKFQEDAIKAIDENKSVVVSAPTGSGKTLIADYIISRDIQRNIKVIYTAPIKALSNQKYKEFTKDYGEHNVGLLTGDVTKNPRAPVLIMTTEVYRNMVIIDDPLVREVSYVIFDEIHYINDPERGYVWEESIIFSPPNVRMLCLSATIPNAEEFAGWIHAILEHSVVVVKHDIRPVPLHISFFDKELGMTSLKAIKELDDIPDYKYVVGHSKERKPRLDAPTHLQLIRQVKDKLPCLFFDFSRVQTQRKALELAKKDPFPFDPTISAFIRERLKDAPKEINQLDSTRILRQTLPYGIGFHHAGLLPLMKDVVEDLFGQGKIKVLYATETFAVGINYPVKTVCFASLRKFDGTNFRLLTAKEFFQIAGRAGRRGIDKEGNAIALIDRRDFDFDRIKKITSGDTEPIQSQYRLGVNTVLNLVRNHDPEEINVILSKSFYSYQKYGKRFATMRSEKSHAAFETIIRKLEKMNYITKGGLTDKGDFASRIYQDEILFTEIFGTEFWTTLNAYQLFLVIATICYEGRERTEFERIHKSADLLHLKKTLLRHPYISKDKRFRDLDKLTALIHPCWHGQNLFHILDKTTLLEGDVIRYFRQIIDRIGQLRRATVDRDLLQVLDQINDKIVVCLKDIDTIA
jgi:superfamily II RNA helicase